MVLFHGWRALGTRLTVLVSAGLLAFVVFLGVATPVSLLALHETEQPEFCISCHLMDPYYDSWQRSSHANVVCVECHYEPGALETLEGKIAAVNQVTRYVTRTEGTKPWADVSDLSCMRTGCHSVRALEGEVKFGEVRFDHTPHLLGNRVGGRLRCTSCHSQVVRTEHISVSATVCFACHFMPAEHGRREPAAGPARADAGRDDCLKCHEPPAGELEVAGRPFSHDEYLERGVSCRSCHADAVQGTGEVRPQRCKSCHGEVEVLERLDEAAFLHEAHVADRKVECFECHDEIRHGLLPLQTPAPADREGCGACHVATHDANRLLYAGTGALGVADRPSRMYEARVVCAACHTGRSGDRREPHGASDDVSKDAHGVAGAGTVASAGAVDCIHCHGPGVDGMLAGWQGVVGGELARLEALLTELDQALVERTEAAAGALRDEARANLELVRMDGSRGAHNPRYALDVLAAAAERIDAARAELAPDTPPEEALTPSPVRLSATGCTDCHLGVERAPLALHGRSFSHDLHLSQVGLDCNACHSLEDHGETASAVADCASCHHEERDDGSFDPEECADCHALQDDFLYGELEGHEGFLTGMEEKECIDCHGEPPDISIPAPKLCVLCHDETYQGMTAEWQTATEALLRRVERALYAPAPGATAADLARAREALRTVRADGSRGVHNHLLAEALLTEALAGLE